MRILLLPVKRFLAALTLLTIIPVPGYCSSEDELAGCKSYFPLVGLIVGVIVYWLAQGLLKFASPSVMCMFLIIALAMASKGFHLDGLADTADGFMSSRPKDRIMEIMHDSRIGSMGVLALVFVLGLKFAGLTSLAAAKVSAMKVPDIILFTPIAGRCAIVAYIQLSRYARETGMGEIMFRRKSFFCFIWVLAFMAGTGWYLFGNTGLAMSGAVAVFVIFWTFYTMCKIGGATGDTIGACEELSEMIVPVFMSCFSGYIS